MTARSRCDAAQGGPAEALTGVDAAWLRMDSPSNPMRITAVLVLQPALPRAVLEEIVRERLLAQHERFRQRVAVRGWRPVWTPDPAFDLRAHVTSARVAAPGDDAALGRLVGELSSLPLPRGRPLWQLHVVEGARAGTAIVARVHHCIGDGVALVRVLLGLTDEGAALGAPPARATPGAEGAGAPRFASLRALRPLAAAIARLTCMRSDPGTLRGPLGVEKRVACSEAVPLEAVKAAGRALGATVNDLALSAVAGALRGYLVSRGGLGPRELRAMVPVDLRGGGDGAHGNRFGLVFPALALSLSDPIERLRETQQRMDALKRSREAAAALGMLGAMGHVGTLAERIGVRLYSGKASVMVTNVRGPTVPLRIAGRTISELMVFAPVAGRLGLSVSFLSYAGALRVGVYADARVVPDPEAITAGIVRELRLLAPLTAPSAWPVARPAPTAPSSARAR